MIQLRSKSSSLSGRRCILGPNFVPGSLATGINDVTMARDNTIPLCCKNGSHLLLCEFVVAEQTRGKLVMHYTSGRHAGAAAEEAEPEGDVRATVLLVGGQVEQYIRLEESASRMVDGYELVVAVCADIVKSDLGLEAVLLQLAASTEQSRPLDVGLLSGEALHTDGPAMSAPQTAGAPTEHWGTSQPKP